jgi:hypothetical protein
MAGWTHKSVEVPQILQQAQAASLQEQQPSTVQRPFCVFG